jgi:hypothetical protein
MILVVMTRRVPVFDEHHTKKQERGIPALTNEKYEFTI